MNLKKEKKFQKKWIACPVEEEFFGSDRKSRRMERKIKSAKDRSKFKKTDRTKHEEELKQELEERSSDQPIFRGQVLSISSQGIVVACEGAHFLCQLRGLLKREKSLARNLVVVGDFVQFLKMSETEGVIANVESRKSILSRADNLSRKKEQLIAANIDQVLITVSLVTPPLKPPLIDRYLIAARKGKMAPVILVNKLDLLEEGSYPSELREAERALLFECQQAYSRTGVPFLPLSAITGEGIDSLKEMMKNRTSVFSGQSGTGKSSLINAVAGSDLVVGEMVRRTRKGSHTTTRAHLIPLQAGGFCIDTPGIKSFGIWDLDLQEIETYFDEIHSCGKGCRFPDCSHSHEVECAVIEAVQQGEISPLRYNSYLSLRETAAEEHRRR